MRRMYKKKQRRRGSDGSFWLSFSDLMSTLVMIFILILFYSMFQYFEMYEIKEAELARQQFDLNSANEQLATEQEKLSEAEQQLIAQQIKLQAAEAGLVETEEILAQQKSELNAANSLLAEKEAELNTLSEQLTQQQAALDAQQVQLNTQQQQITAQQQQLTNQQQQLTNQQEQLEQLVGLRTQIIVALSDALKANNIKAEVDPTTGAIALESDVMFDTAKADLSLAGKRSINEFLPVYLDVLLSDEYRPYVSEIIIEGHTDSEGGYVLNLALSQHRAYAVASYVLGDDYRGITADQKAILREITTANGRSYSDRIMVNGVEDRAASRRVVFKFRMTDEQMIQQMQQILEQNQAADPGVPEAGVLPEITPEPQITPAPAAPAEP